MGDQIEENLKQSELYSHALSVEAQADNNGTTEQAMAADQGHALRRVIYHGLAAIVGAIREK